jgi:hypothetical protein
MPACPRMCHHTTIVPHRSWSQRTAPSNVTRAEKQGLGRPKSHPMPHGAKTHSPSYYRTKTFFLCRRDILCRCAVLVASLCFVIYLDGLWGGSPEGPSMGITSRNQNPASQLYRSLGLWRQPALKGTILFSPLSPRVMRLYFGAGPFIIFLFG